MGVVMFGFRFGMVDGGIMILLMIMRLLSNILVWV